MIHAKTKKGTDVWVALVDDVDENEGGFYCEVYEDPWCDSDRIDDFCIHPEDVDCSNDSEVTAYVCNYIKEVEEY